MLGEHVVGKLLAAVVVVEVVVGVVLLRQEDLDGFD